MNCTITDCIKPKVSADYCGYSEATFLVPFGAAKTFPVGRIVDITITPKGGRK